MAQLTGREARKKCYVLAPKCDTDAQKAMSALLQMATGETAGSRSGAELAEIFPEIGKGRKRK
jgi:hypothetical protein